MMQKNTKIMVMEDFIDTQKYLEMILEEGGFDVCVVATGEECLEKIFQEEPDLVLIDLIMPGISGYDVYATLQKDDRTSSVPVFFLSSMEIHDQKKYALKADVKPCRYISKPIDDKLLIEQIESTLCLR